MSRKNLDEQWLSYGECEVCRRQQYCSKPCKPCQERSKQEIINLVARHTVKAMAMCRGEEDDYK